MNDANSKDMSLTSRNTNLAGLVDYQAGNVVSRMIIERSAGTVTLFAFDKGEGLSEHTAPFDALVHIIDGEAVVTINGKRLIVENGEAVIMPANEPHALKAPKRFEMMLVMIKNS